MAVIRKITVLDNLGKTRDAIQRNNYSRRTRGMAQVMNACLESLRP
jgi:hypothetical protein